MKNVISAAQYRYLQRVAAGQRGYQKAGHADVSRKLHSAGLLEWHYLDALKVSAVEQLTADGYNAIGAMLAP